jgi:hypothetical protein
MKRFTATEKWQDGWYRKLRPALKCLWQYLCDNCDPAGVIEPDWELVSFQIGEAVGGDDLAGFGGRVVPFGERKLQILGFIDFQYGQLSKDCKAHIPIFRALEKHRLPIPSPKAIHSLQEEEEEEDKEREKEKDKEKETEGPKGMELLPAAAAEPKPEDGFAEFWKAYPKRVAKPDALGAWKAHRCAWIQGKILAALARARVSFDWTKEGGQFVPHPETWLNRHGWKDEYTPAAGAAGQAGRRENLMVPIE